MSDQNGLPPEAPDWRNARFAAGVDSGNEAADRALWARMVGAVIKKHYPPIMRSERYDSMSPIDKLKRLAVAAGAIGTILGLLRSLFWGPLVHVLHALFGWDLQ